MLTWFRQHRDWFLSKNMDPPDVQISSTYHFVRSLKQLREPRPPGDGSVIVIFSADKQAPAGTARLRTVIFRMRGGKLDSGAIYIDGYQGKTTSQLLSDEINAKAGP